MTLTNIRNYVAKKCKGMKRNKRCAGVEIKRKYIKNQEQTSYFCAPSRNGRTNATEQCIGNGIACSDMEHRLAHELAGAFAMHLQRQPIRPLGLNAQ